MSFFEVDCPWCDERYSFGIVGKTSIAPPHDCKVERKCDIISCPKLSEFYVTSEIPNGIKGYACGDHIQGRIVIMARGYGDLD